jgi:predicted transcriptional regulator
VATSEQIKLAIEKSKQRKLEKEQKEQEEPDKPVFYKRPRFWFTGLASIGAFLFAKSIFGKKLITLEPSMQLTKNFQLKEFMRSTVIPELRNYKLTEGELENVKRLATVLQSFRDDLGVPIRINSGGRPRGLTSKDGKTFVQILKERNYKPAEFSQHMDFSAADFTTGDKLKLIDIMNAMDNPYYSESMGKTITQIIFYIYNGKPNFIHLGVKSDVNNFMKITQGRRKLLAKVTSKNGKKTYQFLTFTKDKMYELLSE